MNFTEEQMQYHYYKQKAKQQMCKDLMTQKMNHITTYYKLCHSTDDTKEFYIGSTDDFESRMKSHKRACNNDGQYKVYQYIRDNDGFDNWTFEILEQCEGENKQDRLIKEATYIKALKPKLNTHMPGTTHIDKDAKYYCGNCGQRLNGPGRSVAGVRSHHRSIKCKSSKGFNSININGDNNTINIIYRYPE